ncbi:MAG: hypothetical protein Fues2KO_46730 [Fuerstiella sp.]
MKQLLQEIAAFLWHVADAPETAPKTKEVAEELSKKVVAAINEADDNRRSPAQSE